MRDAGLRSRLRAVQMGSRTCPKCGENYAHCLRACQPAKNKGKGLALNNQPAWPGAAVLVSVACHQKKARASIIVAKSCMPPQLHRWVITSTRSSGGIALSPVSEAYPQRSPLRIAQMLEENRHGAAKFPFFARFYIGHIFEKTVLPKGRFTARLPP